MLEERRHSSSSEGVETVTKKNPPSLTSDSRADAFTLLLALEEEMKRSAPVSTNNSRLSVLCTKIDEGKESYPPDRKTVRTATEIGQH